MESSLLKVLCEEVFTEELTQRHKEHGGCIYE